METKKLIKLIKGTVDNNTVLPVLENVKIEDNILTVSDLETTLEIYDIGIKGKGLIHFLDFISAIEMINNYKVEFKDKARIYNDTESVELAMDKIEDFPKKPDVSKAKEIGIIDAEDFDKILIAQDFISNDDLRPAMTTVYVDKDIVATDSHCLYFEKVSEPVKQSYLLPPKIVKLMKIMIKGATQPIDVHANESYIILKFVDAKITFRKLEEKFPNYQAVIPTKHSTKIEVDKKEFADRLTKAVKFATEVNWMIIANITSSLNISSYEEIHDKSYKSDIPISKTGEDVISAFDGKRMIKILSKIKADKVTLKFTGANKAILIQDNFILMPIMQNV